MQPTAPRLILALLFALACPSRAAEPVRAADAQPAYVTDSGKLLPQGSELPATLSAKLAAFERSSGIRILVRFHPASPAAEEDKVPGAYMSALASTLGVEKTGAVAVYFADDPDWRLWIGSELTARFAGQPGTPEALTKSGAIHDAKESFFTTAWAAADAAWIARPKAPDTPNTAPTPTERATLQAAALVDGLILKIRPESH